MLHALLIYQDPSAAPDYEGAEGQAEMREWFTYDREINEAGINRAGEALQPPETATTVRVRDGEVIVTDGPFAETKEVLGGFYLIDVPDLDAAMEWARRMPNAHYGTIEIRPVAVFD